MAFLSSNGIALPTCAEKPGWRQARSFRASSSEMAWHSMRRASRRSRNSLSPRQRPTSRAGETRHRPRRRRRSQGCVHEDATARGRRSWRSTRRCRAECPVPPVSSCTRRGPPRRTARGRAEALVAFGRSRAGGDLIYVPALPGRSQAEVASASLIASASVLAGSRPRRRTHG